MSANVVTPKRICSAAARRVPQRTKSSVTFFASAGKMYFRNQSSSVTSSCKPRRSVMGTCVWPLIKPGRTRAPLASMDRLVNIGPLGMWGIPSPMATIVSSLMTMNPFSITRRSASIVTTMPLLIRRSTKLPGWAGACCCPEMFSAAAEIIAVQANTMAIFLIAFGCRFIVFPHLSRVGRIEGLRKKIAHLERFRFAFQICQDHRNIAAKFPDQLAARAARGRKRVCIGDHGDGVKVTLAFAHGLENRNTLGAQGQSVGGVFDVAAAEDSARSGVQRGSNAKIRVRRVRIFTRLLRRFYERLMFCHAAASRKKTKRDFSLRSK